MQKALKQLNKIILLILSLILSTVFLFACFAVDTPKWPTPPPSTPEVYSQFSTFRIYMHTVPATGLPINYLHRYNWRNARFYMDSDTEAHSFNNVAGRIRGRGNSTWNVSATTQVDGQRIHWDSTRNPASPNMQKWPFRIRFDLPQSMLGSTSVSTDWSFIANLSDYTLLRNEAAIYLARQLTGMDWQTRSRFVHVYFNGDYRGVYWLAEQLEVNNYNPQANRPQDFVSGRVPLVYNINPSLSEYFVELDLRAYRPPSNEPDLVMTEGVDFINVNGRVFDVRFPDDTREVGDNFTRRYRTAGHMAYVTEFLRNVEAALLSGNWARINQWIDIPSMIDMYLVQEFFKEMDVGGLSLHKTIRGTGENRRLHFGPIWDFDLSAGNTDPSETWGARDAWVRRGGHGTSGIWAAYMNRWFRYALRVPQFFELAGQRFNQIAFCTDYRISPIGAMINHIETLSLEYSNEFNRNFTRWNMLLGRRTWTQSPEIVALTTHRQNVEHLLEWFYGRRDQLAHFFTNGSGASLSATLWEGGWL